MGFGSLGNRMIRSSGTAYREKNHLEIRHMIICFVSLSIFIFFWCADCSQLICVGSELNSVRYISGR